MSTPWQLWIDTGGTFTDCLSIDPNGNFKRLKILSNSALRGKIISQPSSHQLKLELYWPLEKNIFKGFTLRVVGKANLQRKIMDVDFKNNIILVDQLLPGNLSGDTIEITSNEEVPVLAARLLTETALVESFPQIEMKLGSTRGTNAILERKGARTAFVVTKGFKDLFLIGNQQRPDLFALNIQKPKPLYDFVIEVDERIEADGNVLTVLSQKECERIAEVLKSKKIDSVAVALMNSYRNPSHELKISDHLKTKNFAFVSVSHQLSSQLKILPRAETTVTNAYLAPIIYNYVGKITEGLEKANLKIMSSAGSLLSADSFHPKDSLLSGPAGGVVGAASVAARSGIDKLITFDMGGTSTDVALYNQRYDYRYESKVGDLKILSPSLAIETIAAGGGSICDFDGYRLLVGPQSAGAFPGPACYGAGGPLTITDVNLLLGRIDATNFAIPLNTKKSEAALQTLVAKIKKATKKNITAAEVLESLSQIANEKMAEAIRKVSVQQGHNPADFTLLSFGGAGGQHACSIAQLLGMNQVLIPYDAGLLSAYGIGHADVERFVEKLILKPLNVAAISLGEVFTELRKRGEKQLVSEGYDVRKVALQKQLLFLRFKGQESTIEFEYSQGMDIVSAFKEKYESIFGHWLDKREIELESVKVIVAVKGHSSAPSAKEFESYEPTESKTGKLLFRGAHKGIRIYEWEKLTAGAFIKGPVMIVSKNSTTIVDPGWNFVLDGNNNALLQFKKQKVKGKNDFSETANLELFTNRFTALAQEMGALLQRTSFSVNVKERLDFSCALLDPDGFLVVNAPHIPVHLGSLGVCVREVRKAIEMNEGDVIITNHPAFGGSHLPDVTLIKPVFFKKQLVGYVANRAHHAEIGGKKPGSMPSDAKMLSEEGVIIRPAYLVKNGKVKWDEIKTIFTSAEYPTRLLEENLADLNGALASVNLGEKLLIGLCEEHDHREIVDYMKRLRVYASQLLKEKLIQLPAKSWKAEERLDDGSKLKVNISRQGQNLKIDFTGSAKVHAGNLNATSAIVQSVVLYVLRLVVDQPIPMNEGLMENVKLILPQGLLNPDFSNEQNLPAVVGGNTEVSQRLTDTLIKAFGLAACSQGTMNNFLFGTDAFGYYETICGGVGAGDGFNGADAVHQHMTNTRITDPEVLELRYPVRLDSFEIRKNSGGKGKWNGGNGIIRKIVANENLEINLLTQHRIEKPYGLKGGESGKPGKQFIIRANGRKEKLKGMDGASLLKGDQLIIATPGGGGYGKRKKPSD
jgi:5-oxoprolinase (ATP-hydrolysing)